MYHRFPNGLHVFLCSGSLILAHGERNKTMYFTAVANGSEAASYAVHLTDATAASAAVRFR